MLRLSLDIAAGLILLMSLVIFYEKTVVFYVLLQIHGLIFGLLLGIVFKFKETIEDLFKDPPFMIGYFIPLAMELLFSAICIFSRAKLYEIMTLQEVYLICAIPTLVVAVPFFLPILQNLASDYAKSYIYYDSLNLLGIVLNGIILQVGGQVGWIIFRRYFQS